MLSLLFLSCRLLLSFPIVVVIVGRRDELFPSLELQGTLSRRQLLSLAHMTSTLRVPLSISQPSRMFGEGRGSREGFLPRIDQTSSNCPLLSSTKGQNRKNRRAVTSQLSRSSPSDSKLSVQVCQSGRNRDFTRSGPAHVM